VGDQLVEQKGTMDERDARWTARAKFALHPERRLGPTAAAPLTRNSELSAFTDQPISQLAVTMISDQRAMLAAVTNRIA
jgi:hypothetical protein